MPSGIGGYVQFSGARRDVRRWTFGKDADIQDATDSGAVDGWKRKEATLLDASGSMELLWKVGEVLEADLSVDVGDQLPVVLHVGTTGLGYSGTVVVKHIETTNDATGPLLTQALNWEANGPMVGPYAVPP